ncbi:MAG: hypothetical protein EOP61_39885 [Sphingomonadales bacterium]|nr:MAG: hypothetical protein EOP61_39885 [Sphingomonadales bacterium]
MTILCKLTGHAAGTKHHQNQGLEFAICHQCGCDLIRAESNDWTEVPKGFRVVWREFGRAGDAASVAARMQRIAQPARRRPPRTVRSEPRRDPRSRPLTSATAMFGLIAGLRSLIESDENPDTPAMDANGQYVICLPHAGNR